MSSSDRQPEGFLMEEFGGRQAELVDKLSEISTSMRQCADIVDSFSRIVSQISFWPMATDTAAARQPPGLGHSRGVGSALGPAYERLDPSSVRSEGVGSPSQVQGAETYRRPSHFAAGSMRPPAIPTFHSAALPGLSSMSAPPTFPHPRPSSATSAAGPIDAGGLARFTVDATASASERRASSAKHGKRKRPQRAESGEFGEDSGGETGTDASPRADVYEGTSEIDHPIRQPMRHPAGGLEETLGARVFSPKGHAAAEGSRTEHRASDSATGPSIVVFSSGSGPSKSRAIPARAPGPSSSSRSRKEKKPRDPNAPKQPPPAYIVYQNEIRETMRARFPTHSPTELVKEIAATWKTLSNAERQQYKDQANIEKDRWVAELAAYQASLAPPDEAHAGKSSEGTFLATVGVSDSPPPASSPRQSPGLSDMEVEYKPRLTTSQDMPSSNPYPAPVRGAASFPGPGVAALPPSLSPTSESRSGRSSRQGYSYGPDNPPRPERALSRHGYPAAPAYGHMPMPSATASRPHLLGHMEPRTSSTRLPGIGSLGLTPQQGVREPSPGPARERSETEGEPASKRQRTGTNPSSEEEGSGGLNRSAREGLESE